MKNYFIIIILLILSLIYCDISFAEKRSYESYSLIITYQNGDLLQKNIFLIQSPNEIFPSETGDYILKVYSFKEKKLYESKFSIPLKTNYEPNPDWFDENGNQIIIPNGTSIQEITKIDYNIFIPYFKNAKKINIFKDNKLRLEIDVSEFSICNENEICDNKETPSLCPDECKKEEEPIKIPLNYVYYVLGIILFAVISLFIYKHFKNKAIHHPKEEHHIKKHLEEKGKEDTKKPLYCHKCGIKLKGKFCSKCGAKR